MAERCATCKHWREYPAAISVGQEHTAEHNRRAIELWAAWRGQEDIPAAVSSYTLGPGRGICMRAAGPDHLSETMDDAVMFVQDKSDYSACLVTKAEFGCVLHEVKS